MLKFFQETKGVISIFLAMIMLPTFLCAGLVVDGARVSAARTAASGAGDLAMNAALSEYDEVLLDVYGLFAISEDMEDLEKNVSRYFTNTLHKEGILQTSDSYTRQFINSIGSMFSTDEIAFENIIDTEVESFNLQAVPSSALANPYVLEKQIIEHMKYRGPVSLGTGLLTKLSCISETSKQTAAIESKVEYEQQLDKVQDVCEAAYIAIKDYENEILNGIKVLEDPIYGGKEQGKGYSADNYFYEINSDMGHADWLLKMSTIRAVVYRSPDIQAGIDLSSDNSVSSAAADNVDKFNEVYGQFVSMRDSRNNIISSLVQPTSTSAVKEMYHTVPNAENNLIDGLKVYLDKFAYCKDHEAELKKLRASADYLKSLDSQLTKKTPIEITDKSTEEEKQKAAEIEEYNVKIDAAKALVPEIDATIAELNTIQKNFDDTYTGLKSYARLGYERACTIVNDWYTETNNIITKLDTAIAATNAILDSVDTLKTYRENWNRDINQLSESEVKTSMKGDYDNVASSVNKTGVEELVRTLTANKAHFEEIKGRIERETYYDKKLCDAEMVDFDSVFGPLIGNDTVTKDTLHSMALQKLKLGGLSFDPQVHAYTTEKFLLFSTGGDIKGAEFYKFLKNTCGTKGVDATTEEAKTATNNAKAERKTLLNNANTQSQATAGGEITNAGVKVDAYGISPEIIEAINQYAAANGKGESFMIGALENGDDDDAMSTSAKSNVTNVTAMLDGLANIGKTAVEKVYLEEYFTEMFSCYTSGVEPSAAGEIPERKGGDKLSLHGDDMSGNKHFGSEVEYILYGLDSPKANINASKASIFGIRFALNSIHALTSTHTRAPALSAATAIAGWTGFGVPVVQTVILLAWSMAESALDLTYLCNGYDVVIYKTENSWMTGMNGLKEAGKQVANMTINNVFDKIESLTESNINEVTDSINNYVSDTTAGVVENIQGTIMTNIETLAINIIGESNYNLQESDITRKVDAMLDNMAASAQGDDIIAQATRLGIEAVKTITIRATSGEVVTIREYMISTIYDSYTKAKDGLNNEISGKITEMHESIADPIEQAITGKVSELGDTLKAEVSAAIAKGSDTAKREINNLIDKYTKDLGGVTMENGVSKSGASIATGFTLNYKEYMKTLLMITIALPDCETSMLKRCAHLIQENLSQKDNTFDISKAYTMVKADATVTVGTTFFDVPVASGVDETGRTIYTLDFSRLGTGRQTVNYSGARGY